MCSLLLPVVNNIMRIETYIGMIFCIFCWGNHEKNTSVDAYIHVYIRKAATQDVSSNGCDLAWNRWRLHANFIMHLLSVYHGWTMLYSQWIQHCISYAESFIICFWSATISEDAMKRSDMKRSKDQPWKHWHCAGRLRLYPTRKNACGTEMCITTWRVLRGRH